MWHSIVDDADYEHITVLKRPVDCDFMHAPIGSKGCEYEKKTEVFGEKQRNQMLQQAITDDERREIQNRSYTVTVYWEKKEN